MIGLLETMRERLSSDAWLQLERFAHRHSGVFLDEVLVTFDLGSGQPVSVLGYIDSSNPAVELAAAAAPPAPQGLAEFWRGVPGAGVLVAWSIDGDAPRGAYVGSRTLPRGFDFVGCVDGQPELIGDVRMCPLPVDIARLEPLDEIGPVHVRYWVTGSAAAMALHAIEVLPEQSSQNMAEAQRLISMLLDADAVDQAFVERLLTAPFTPQVMVSSLAVSPSNRRQGTIILGARPASRVRVVEEKLLN